MNTGEYTYFTEMLYEKPMGVWKIAQYKSILVYLNNGIMISGNGHDMSPTLNYFQNAQDKPSGQLDFFVLSCWGRLALQ